MSTYPPPPFPNPGEIGYWGPLQPVPRTEAAAKAIEDALVKFQIDDPIRDIRSVIVIPISSGVPQLHLWLRRGTNTTRRLKFGWLLRTDVAQQLKVNPNIVILGQDVYKVVILYDAAVAGGRIGAEDGNEH